MKNKARTKENLSLLFLFFRWYNFSMANKKFFYELLIILGAGLWGLMAVVPPYLYDRGIQPIQITFFRGGATAILLGIFILIKNPKLFIIKIKDLWMFLLVGILGYIFFNFTFMFSIKENSVSVASMLVYTSPVWITIMSRIIFKEKLTLKKIVCIVGVLTGMVLLVGMGEFKITTLGLWLGIGSGLGYGIYNVASKLITAKYPTETNLFYTFLIAGLVALPFANVSGIVSAIKNDISTLWFFLLLAIFDCFIPYILYTTGLKHTPVSTAGVLSITEPVTGALGGVILLGDKLGFLGFIGIIIIVGFLVLLELEVDIFKKKNKDTPLKKEDNEEDTPNSNEDNEKENLNATNE